MALFFNKLIDIIAILFIINKNTEEDKCINKLKNRKRQTNNKKANNKVQIKIYSNNKFSVKLENVDINRFLNTSTRSSARYLKGYYEKEDEYEKYRNSIRELELPQRILENKNCSIFQMNVCKNERKLS